MINLLPKEIKVKRQISHKVNGVITLYIFAIILLALGIAGIFLYNVSLKVEIDNKNQQLSDISKDKSENQDLISKASFIEDRVNSSKNYLETIKWEDALNQIASSTPSDIQLTEIKITLETTKPSVIGINGKTTERRSIILFKEKLAELPFFTGLKLTNISDSDSAGKQEFTFTIQSNINQANVNQK